MVCRRLWSAINLLINVCLGRMHSSSLPFVKILIILIHLCLFQFSQRNNDWNCVAHHIYRLRYFIGKFCKINQIFELNSIKLFFDAKRNNSWIGAKYYFQSRLKKIQICHWTDVWPFCLRLIKLKKTTSIS